MPEHDRPLSSDPGHSTRWSPPKSVMDWGALSHAGYVRPVNTDTFYVGRFDRTLEPVLTSLSDASAVSWDAVAGHVAIVADGLDIGAIGAVASRTAVGTLLELMLETPDWIMRLDDPSLVEEVSRRVRRRLRQIDQLLASIGESTPLPQAMATTLTILGVLPPDGMVAHVGHSRAYLQKAGSLVRMTHDHTASQALADVGLLEEGAVGQHPAREAILRAVGFNDERLVVDVVRFDFRPGDRVVVCSDGLTAAVTDDEVNEVLSASASSALACRALVDLALARGGHDNVTVIIGHLPRAGA
jgi:PPM family protein phosphatase